MNRISNAEPAPSGHTFGFCALLGRPNVGKSTLINQLVGTKVAIVTPKPQTTRNRILGVLNRPEAQIVVVDTPGLGAGQGPLRQALTRSAGAAVSDADLVVVVAEASPRGIKITEADRQVFRTAQAGHKPILMALNKIDAVSDKRQLLPMMAAYQEASNVLEIVPVSARTGDGIDQLIERIAHHLPPGEPMFPADMHTDQVERFMCAEMVREQLLMRTQQEVPHSAHVTLDVFEDGRNDATRPLCHLEGRIIVERDSQKAIVIGHLGSTIKAISTIARAQIEELLGCQVFLRLQVQVDPRWTTRPDALRRYGLSPQEATV